jgi:hypothetical protein
MYVISQLSLSLPLYCKPKENFSLLNTGVATESFLIDIPLKFVSKGCAFSPPVIMASAF